MLTVPRPWSDSGDAKVVAMLGAGDIGVMIKEVTEQLLSPEK